MPFDSFFFSFSYKNVTLVRTWRVLEHSRRSYGGGTSESRLLHVPALFLGFELFISCEVIGSKAACSAPLLQAPNGQQRHSSASPHVV